MRRTSRHPRAVCAEATASQRLSLFLVTLRGVRRSLWVK
jgi:hypothetical protein